MSPKGFCANCHTVTQSHSHTLSSFGEKPLRINLSSANLSSRAVRRFLCCIEAIAWRIAYGRFDENSRLIRADAKRHENLSREDIIELVPFLKAQNSKGMSIYIGTMTHSHVYVDDVPLAQFDAFNALNLPVIAAILTSPGSHQMWFPVPDGVSAWSLSSGLRKIANGDAGAHASGANMQPRIARLPGFTNTKPKHRASNGQYPFVQIVRSTLKQPSEAQLDALRNVASSNTLLSASNLELQSQREHSAHTPGPPAGRAREKAGLRP
eukprot:gene46837-58411_t